MHEASDRASEVVFQVYVYKSVKIISVNEGCGRDAPCQNGRN